MAIEQQALNLYSPRHSIKDRRLNLSLIRSQRGSEAELQSLVLYLAEIAESWTNMRTTGLCYLQIAHFIRPRLTRTF
jgi:hypothetical protein